MPLVQLVNNYRGHPETIDICSYMIYEDLMKPGIVPWPCRDDSTGAKVAAFMATDGTNNMFPRSIDYKQSGRVWFVDTVDGKTVREPGVPHGRTKRASMSSLRCTRTRPPRRLSCDE
jgi:hypothetical protein